LREKPKLKVLENRVLRRIFGAKTDEVTGGRGEARENCIMRTFTILTPHQILSE